MFKVYGGFPKLGIPFGGGPQNKDSRVLGSILGSLYFGKLLNKGTKSLRVVQDVLYPE